MEKLWKKFYECECHTEGIMVSMDDEFDKSICMAFFGHGYQGTKFTFFQKLRWCWRILKKGHPYEDEVMFDKDTALDLGKDLLEWGSSPDKEV